MTLRRNTVAKEAVHIAVGITVEGTKEILGYSIAPNESAKIWKELLKNFKSRGLEKVSLFCTDGLVGMKRVIEQTFLKAKIQRCLVHISRNIAAKVHVTDKKEIMDDFKEVYNTSKLEEAISNLYFKMEKKIA